MVNCFWECFVYLTDLYTQHTSFSQATNVNVIQHSAYKIIENLVIQNTLNNIYSMVFGMMKHSFTQAHRLFMSLMKILCQTKSQNTF